MAAEDRQIKRLYEFGPFHVDAVERQLWRDGQPVPLPPKVFDTLLALIERSGRLVEKDELMARLWPDTFVEESTLAHNVSELRKALGEAAGRHKYIETVSKRGYRFIGGVRALPADTPMVEKHASLRIVTEETEPAPARQEIFPASGAAQHPTRWRIRPAALLVAALLAGLAAALFYVWPARSREAGTATPVKSIAVLPFQPMSGQEGDESLEFGMADALITRLSNAKIIVRPTSAIIKYHKAGQDAAAAGRELRVDALLEGRIQKSGDRVRVTAQLVSAADGRPLWAGQFDAKSADIFTLQDSISEQIMRTLEVQLSGPERRQLTRRHTASVEAFQAYAKGRLCWNRRSAEGFRKAIDYFNEALSLDPEYALAWAGLADCYASLSPYMLNPPSESFPRAREAARKALAIDDSLAEAHTSLAHILFIYDWDWQGAEKEYQRAIELNPNYPTAHQWYAVYLSAMGRNEEAIAQARRAQEIDPVSLPIARDLTRAFYLARQYDQAIAVSMKTLELNSNAYRLNSPLEMAYEQQGLYDQAIEARLKACSVAGFEPQMIAALRKEYQALGWKGFWQRELSRTEELAKREYVSPYLLVRLYARLGEKEKAFAWLEKAYNERSDHLIFLNVDPILDPLRSDPRFVDLLRRVGLAP